MVSVRIRVVNHEPEASWKEKHRRVSLVKIITDALKASRTRNRRAAWERILVPRIFNNCMSSG